MFSSFYKRRKVSA